MPLGPKMAEARRLRAHMGDADLRFVMLGLFGALVVGLVTAFGPHGASALAVERGLGAAVTDALGREGFIGVRVTMRGQTAILDGVASSREQAERAGRVARRAAGPGGLLSGGVVTVINRVVAAEAATDRRALSAAGEDDHAETEKLRQSPWKQAGVKLAERGSHGPAGASILAMAHSVTDFDTALRTLTAERRGASWPM